VALKATVSNIDGPMAALISANKDVKSAMD